MNVDMNLKMAGKMSSLQQLEYIFEQKIVETKSSATGRAVKKKSTPQVLDEVVGKERVKN